MILLVSGEGSSDIGTSEYGADQDAGAAFRPGPMAVMIDKLFDLTAQFSLLDSGAMEFVSKHDLCALSKRLPMALAGRKRGYEMAVFFKNARALARLAKEKARSLPPATPVGAVLFHDADGTRSTERGLAETKRESISTGFAAEDFANGVPMVPKPKSEAWLLCALKPHPYQSCAGLETSLSGNDNAPHSAKDQLTAVLTARGKTVGDLADMVRDGTVSPSRIDMPSFNQFRDRLATVVCQMLGRPVPP